MQEVPPAEPVEEGDEGGWDIVGEPAGSRSPAPTVEELLAQLERQPPAPRRARSPQPPPLKRWWPRERMRALHRPPSLQRKQWPPRCRRRRPPRVDW
jgi:hypothetical protein